HPPIANAGADQTVNEGSAVTLHGTASQDPDGDPIVSYTWSQVSGPAVQMSDVTSAIPDFTAPVTGPGGTTLVFRLVVDDGQLSSAPDQITVTVLDINDPPRCDLARASQAQLWPANHKLIPVGIAGITDPNNDQVTITITSVTQDEPVKGLGDGDTSS